MTMIKSILVLFCLCTGCISVRDVTGNKNYDYCQGDYVPGAVYQLGGAVALGKFTSAGTLPMFSPTPRYELFPPETRADHKDILSKGTRLRFRSVLYHDYFEDTDVFPIAEIIDGRWAGKRVGIANISKKDFEFSKTRRSQQYFRDPKWLEEFQ